MNQAQSQLNTVTSLPPLASLPSLNMYPAGLMVTCQGVMQNEALHYRISQCTCVHVCMSTRVCACVSHVRMCV